ncbi:MAG: hypothetical protein ACXVB9_19890 [Bdellovibrionota bacterium]
MKIIQSVIVFALIGIAGPLAHAAPSELRNCKSEIVTEVFTSCPGGEGGSATPCGSKVTKWGNVVANLTVDSDKKSASATLTYTSPSGAVMKSNTKCSLGSDNWMSCETVKAVPSLGRLSISFNIAGIAPGVYFADIFADSSNVPVGGFQNTDSACQ